MSWVSVCAFDVQGEPKGQPRQRHFAMKVKKLSKKTGRIEDVWTSRNYDPATAEGWKALVASAARPYLQTEPLNCPLRLVIILFFPRPQRLMRAKDPEGPIPCTAKPDFDNAAKTIADCLTQIGMWRDDKLICSHEFEKYYAAKASRPGAAIQIFRREEE